MPILHVVTTLRPLGDPKDSARTPSCRLRGFTHPADPFSL